MGECFVGRQPIFDRENKVYAYDLLYRNSLDNEIGTVNRTVATSRVIVDAFVEIGLEALVGQHRAFLNIDQSFLIDPDLVLVPAERVVLQVPGTTRATTETVEAIDHLKLLGYEIALNGYRSDLPGAELLDRADIVKLDAMSIGDAALHRELQLIGDRSVVRVAKRVETGERRDRLADLGFDAFQGHFLARPEIVTGDRLPSNRMAVLELVTKVSDPNVDGEELANLIALDASLSMRILRFVNSPLSGLSSEVESIQHAVVLVGRETIKSWVMLLALTGLGDSVPELITTAFVRAKVCELLAGEARLSAKESFFTVGLFSLMDAVMASPMDDLVKTLPFSPEVKTALTNKAGVRGEAVRCAQELEHGAPEGTAFQDVPGPRIAEIYLNSLNWADQMTAGVR
ncbi:MAG: EAL and HDOD domain-containing protein [Acidimicrobiales bacterium]